MLPDLQFNFVYSSYLRCVSSEFGYNHNVYDSCVWYGQRACRANQSHKLLRQL